MDRAELRRAYVEARAQTERLTEPLAIEDYVVQPHAEVSPAKWHLAHTTWFFETLVIAPTLKRTLDPQTQHLFNSYYESIGERTPQAERGHHSRPTVREVKEYRRRVDEAMLEVIEHASPELADLIITGINHEQQHQELLVTDIKRAFFQAPLFPAYKDPNDFAKLPKAPRRPAIFKRYEATLTSIGHDGRGFAFDNEQPRHTTYVNAFELADRLVTQGEYLEFIRDGGYDRPELWLADGWATIKREHWRAPLYWLHEDDTWREHTLYGVQPIIAEHPLEHVSYYEANAYAAWKEARLPSEAEWEHAATAINAIKDKGSLLDDGNLHPTGHAMIGEVWEWTQSAYLPHPGYKRPPGTLGEYNGKFMSGQMVLKGGSCATPASHIRVAYRNFFQPEKRWQMMGIRLARDSQ